MDSGTGGVIPLSVLAIASSSAPFPLKAAANAFKGVLIGSTVVLTNLVPPNLLPLGKVREIAVLQVLSEGRAAACTPKCKGRANGRFGVVLPWFCSNRFFYQLH